MDRCDIQLALGNSTQLAATDPMGGAAGLDSSTGVDLMVERLLVLRDAIQRIKKRVPLPILTFGDDVHSRHEMMSHVRQITEHAFPIKEYYTYPIPHFTYKQLPRDRPRPSEASAGKELFANRTGSHRSPMF
jgi:hypothetical protein